MNFDQLFITGFLGKTSTILSHDGVCSSLDRAQHQKSPKKWPVDKTATNSGCVFKFLPDFPSSFWDFVFFIVFFMMFSDGVSPCVGSC